MGRLGSRRGAGIGHQLPRLRVEEARDEHGGLVLDRAPARREGGPAADGAAVNQEPLGGERGRTRGGQLFVAEPPGQRLTRDAKEVHAHRGRRPLVRGEHERFRLGLAVARDPARGDPVGKRAAHGRGLDGRGGQGRRARRAGE